MGAFKFLVALFLGWPACPASADETMSYVHHSDRAAQETRNDYTWHLLQTALDHTRSRYGDYALTSSSLIDERPNGVSLIKGEGGITVSVFTSRAGYSGKLIPVRIPIDRGVLGYRLLLIRAAEQAKFDRLAESGDLGSLKFGALVSWSDVAIMNHAGFTIVTGESFEGLFKMLVAQRFDALSRGANEIERELTERQKDLPGIAIERSLVLHYPMPVYFWFRNDREGRKLADRVRVGLRAMLADGSFDRLFHQEFDPALSRLDLTHRHVIELENPLLPADEPLKDRSLWYDPKKAD